MDNLKSVPVNSVVFDESAYPRSGFDQDIVNRYRQVIDKLPPIEITHENILIDGYHRLIAYRVEQRETISAVVEELPRELVLWESVKRNARHGYQLSQADKKRLGRHFYSVNGHSVDEIADALSVTPQSVYNWTQDIRQEEDDERDQKVWEMWLECRTFDEIATANGYGDKSGAAKAVDRLKKSKLLEIQLPDSLQIFNLWNFHTNDDRYGIDYPGRIPGQIVENVLYFYTNPFDTVVDPATGGGTTLDVCKAMARRYRCYDIKPVLEDIKQHDITTGFPVECKGCSLIFFDPPYWSQKQGDYSADETNLANLPLDKFYQALDQIFESAHVTLADGGHIAVIIGPTQSKGIIYDHAFELSKLLERRFSFVNRVIVPYTTQQAKAYHVSDAKEGRYMLKLYRDLLIYQKA